MFKCGKVWVSFSAPIRSQWFQMPYHFALPKGLPFCSSLGNLLVKELCTRPDWEGWTCPNYLRKWCVLFYLHLFLRLYIIYFLCTIAKTYHMTLKLSLWLSHSKVEESSLGQIQLGEKSRELYMLLLLNQFSVTKRDIRSFKNKFVV